jgi:hypothetical protein
VSHHWPPKWIEVVAVLVTTRVHHVLGLLGQWMQTNEANGGDHNFAKLFLVVVVVVGLVVVVVFELIPGRHRRAVAVESYSILVQYDWVQPGVQPGVQSGIS